MSSITDTAIDINLIETIVKANLLSLSASEKKNLPIVVSKPEARIFTLNTDAYLIASIVQRKERSRLIKLQKEGSSPFHELIKPYFVSAPTAFVIGKSKNVLIKNCSVQKMFSFSLEKDCTVILVNHKQLVAEKKVGVTEYSIELAFIVSYGNEINTENIYDFLEDLVKYYVTTTNKELEK